VYDREMFGGPRITQARRRVRLAVMACALWVLGFEALPDLHIALHDRLAPHRHDGATIVTVTFGEPVHRHPDGSLHRATDEAPRRRRPDDLHAQLATALAHGDHGLAHHGLAATPPPPPLLRPLPVRRLTTFAIAAQAIAPWSFSPGRAVARGPPRASSC
jgi:hypothetical protein